MKNYGKELIIDIYDCNSTLFNRKDIEKYFIQLCELIKMQREDLHWWDYEGRPEEYKKAPPHLKGTSAIQFIKTSNITIHTLDDLNRIYLNIFSCKDFDTSIVIDFTTKYFGGRIINKHVVDRI